MSEKRKTQKLTKHQQTTQFYFRANINVVDEILNEREIVINREFSVPMIRSVARPPVNAWRRALSKK